MRFQNRVALVTGAGSGIGRATATAFAREGASVMVVDRNADTARVTAEAIVEDGGEAVAVTCDIGSPDDLVALGAAVEQRYGRLDVLVNNAGIRHYGPITEADALAWDDIFAVNLRGAALCARQVLALMVASGGGAIVNVSSVHAWSGRSGMALYDSMKAGLLGLTRSMACDHADDGIRVNAVLPGQTLTEFHVARAAEEGHQLDESVTERHEGGPSLLRRRAAPEEIATAILFLCSDDASYITGASLAVDGGMSATSQAN